jgi:uncharacterized membrane protein (DUF2068 family)
MSSLKIPWWAYVSIGAASVSAIYLDIDVVVLAEHASWISLIFLAACNAYAVIASIYYLVIRTQANQKESLKPSDASEAQQKNL